MTEVPEPTTSAPASSPESACSPSWKSSTDKARPPDGDASSPVQAGSASTTQNEYRHEETCGL